MKLLGWENMAKLRLLLYHNPIINLHEDAAKFNPNELQILIMVHQIEVILKQILSLMWLR